MSNIGNKETMAKNLSFYLDKSGKTQKELAEIVGVATSTFNDWMKAKKYPRIDKIEIMANYFGILKSDLIEEKELEEVNEKNNDLAVKVIMRINTDEVFADVVSSLYNMDSAQLEGVKALLAFNK